MKSRIAKRETARCPLSETRLHPEVTGFGNAYGAYGEHPSDISSNRPREPHRIVLTQTFAHVFRRRLVADPPRE